MNNRYRLVHFVPDFMTPGRVPVAALLESPHGTEVVVPGFLPRSEAVGGPEKVALCKLLLEMLCETSSFESLPRALNNLAVLGSPTELPEGCGADWISKFVFPVEVGRIKGQHRSTEGMDALLRAFERRRDFKKHWIKPKFEAREKGPHWFRDIPKLPTVSQWSEAGQQLFLLEPVVVDRPSLKEDIEKVSLVLSGYSAAAEHLQQREKVHTFAYLSGSRSDVSRKDVRKELEFFADAVFDLESTSDVNQLALALIAARNPIAEAK